MEKRRRGRPKGITKRRLHTTLSEPTLRIIDEYKKVYKTRAKVITKMVKAVKEAKLL